MDNKKIISALIALLVLFFGAAIVYRVLGD